MVEQKNRFYRGLNDMKPRIFVSSTFYDLKFVREDISNFIKVHDFEPVLFEDGNIGYTPGIAPDESCYEAMRSADMVILIVGGHYGSRASSENVDFRDYLSVTRKEFKTAIDNSIPVYAFIDSSVLIEYDIYDRNSESIENDPSSIVFCAVKDINVFRFIKEIRGISHIIITPFNKVNDIKDFLGRQWADMFKTYLSSLKEKAQIEALQDTVDSMKKFMQRMNVMLDGIGKKVLDDKSKINYDDVIELQTQLDLNRICYGVAMGITFLDGEKIENRRVFIDQMLSILEKINLEGLPHIPKEQIEISSDIGKNFTIKIMTAFAKSLMPIHILSKEIVSCMYELQEHLNSAEKREYILSHLVEDELFLRMTDSKKKLELMKNEK